MEKRTIGTWRVTRPHCPNIGPDKKKLEGREECGWFPATRFFDQFSYIGDSTVGCFVLETEDGLVQFDCMNPNQYDIDVIEDGYKELGLDIHDLKAIILTHGHGDHWGCCKYMKDTYGCKVYMSKIDHEFCTDEANVRPGRPRFDCEVDGYLDDGDVFELGGAKVKVYMTPGHTPGGLSFLIPVTDEGRPHTVALWGGTGTPRGPAGDEKVHEACRTYCKSVQYFVDVCVENNADVEVSAHPFVDNAVERLALCRGIFDGVANPFVVGVDGVCRFMYTMCDMIKRESGYTDL